MKVASRFVSEGMSLSYAIADRSDFSYELSEFGLGAAEGELPVVTLRTAAGEKYAMQEEFT
ncbi:UNVERIFIED_CONTAM: hypothetical protein FKN15_040424 [Acipenser sinensis]